MAKGIPCNLTMSLTNVCTIWTTINECLVLEKWAYLLSLSTTTIMALTLWDLGKPSMKSMEISSHMRSGISRGCNSPTGLRHFVLFFWQMIQEDTYDCIHSFIPDHQACCFIRRYVRTKLECPPKTESWNSLKSFTMMFRFLDETILPWHRKQPCLSE